MKRWVFLASALCLAAISSNVGAQRVADLPRVAILSPDPGSTRSAASLFLEVLRDLGYEDGRNIRLQSRFAENRLDVLPALAAGLVKGRPDVIYTYNTAGAFAAARATRSIPIVAGPVGEQTMEQLAGNFAQPVANVTGFVSFARHADEKCLQLLKEAAPAAARHGFGLHRPARGRICAPDNSRRAAERAPGRAPGKVSIVGQSRHRQGARPDDPADNRWPRRRGHRIAALQSEWPLFSAPKRPN